MLRILIIRPGISSSRQKQLLRPLALLLEI